VAFKVAIVGATGLVGGQMLKVMEERKLPVEAFPVASKGGYVRFMGKDVEVLPLSEDRIPDVDFALFAVEKEVSLQFAPLFVQKGITVIDNSTAFRYDPNVPLVVPEINPGAIEGRLIANPNCSTIIFLRAIYPLHRKWKLKSAIVSTYQAVSGAGREGVFALEDGGLGPFIFPIQGNVIPLIGSEGEDGYTTEEMKFEREGSKILGEEVSITATCVRVPVHTGHCMSATLFFSSPPSIEEAESLIAEEPGLVLHSDLPPVPMEVAGTDSVLVGRIRRDRVFPSALCVWICGDNLRVGAASNAVGIMEEIWRRDF